MGCEGVKYSPLTKRPSLFISPLAVNLEVSSARQANRGALHLPIRVAHAAPHIVVRHFVGGNDVPNVKVAAERAAAPNAKDAVGASVVDEQSGP